MKSFVLLTILITTVLLASVTGQAQDDTSEDVIATLPQRQMDTLAEIAGMVQAVTLEKAAALFFLEADQDEANQLLMTYQSDGTTLPQLSIVLRLLHTDAQRQTAFLNDETKKHIQDQISQLVLEGGQLFYDPFNTHLTHDSQKFLSLSNLILWASYVKNQELGYKWPGKPNNSEYLEIFLTTLDQWLNTTIKQGPQESCSPYYSFYLTGLFNLRDFIHDQTLRTKADALIDLLLSDIALLSLNDIWGGAQTRIIDSVSSFPSWRLHWVFFGIPLMNSPYLTVHPLTFHIATTRYQIPPLIVHWVRERDSRGTFEFKKRFETKTALENKLSPMDSYAYVTPNYILGSFQLQNQAVPWQSRPWDLMLWDEDSYENHLFSFVGNSLYSGGQAPYQDEYFDWNATTIQHKNILFCQYHRANRKRGDSLPPNPIIDEHYVRLSTRLWIPNLFSPVTEEDDWWFIEENDVYIAFRPIRSKAYWWRTAQTDMPGGSGASLLNFFELNSGFLLEVEDASRFTSFEQFKNQIKTAPLEVHDDFVTFVSRTGDVFLFPRGSGDFLVNGQPVPIQQPEPYMSIDSPYISSEYGSGYYRAEWNSYSFTIDIRNPEHPRRIIDLIGE